MKTYVRTPKLEMGKYRGIFSGVTSNFSVSTGLSHLSDRLSNIIGRFVLINLMAITIGVLVSEARNHQRALVTGELELIRVIGGVGN